MSHERDEHLEPPDSLSELPADARFRSALALSGGGLLLVAAVDGGAWTIAPPWSPLDPAEEPDDILEWRWAWWPADEETGRVDLSSSPAVKGHAPMADLQKVGQLFGSEEHRAFVFERSRALVNHLTLVERTGVSDDPAFVSSRWSKLDGWDAWAPELETVTLGDRIRDAALSAADWLKDRMDAGGRRVGVFPLRAVAAASARDGDAPADGELPRRLQFGPVRVEAGESGCTARLIVGEARDQLWDWSPGTPLEIAFLVPDLEPLADDRVVGLVYFDSTTDEDQEAPVEQFDAELMEAPHRVEMYVVEAPPGGPRP